VNRILITGFVASLAATTASADTLREALNATYRSNPTLMAQREALKSSDAAVAIAKAGGRPTVFGNVGLTRDLTRSGRFNTGGTKGPFLTGSVGLDVPIFQGGTVKNNISAAATRVAAGRATLRAVEGDVFADAVAAYMDVIRDRAIVELNQNNVRVLTTNLEATSDRFQIGDLTRTDVAQSEARLSLANSDLITARARLTQSEENYRRVIGHDPGALAPPPPLPPLPQSADAAVQIALVNNPDLTAITRQAEAANFDVRSARGTRLPNFSARLAGDYANTLSGDTNGLDRSGTATSVGLNGTIPIYQGGLPSARVRQAQALEGQALEQRVATERLVVASTRTAYALYVSATAAIVSNEKAVSANELALEGARAENSIGTRTVLDVLDAEQELLNAQVALVTARRIQYVAGFELLNAMGQAEAADLGLEGGPLYDPLGNYRKVAGDWNDWSENVQVAPVSTTTVKPQERPVALTPGVTPPAQ
jgi:outer membrane protein